MSTKRKAKSNDSEVTKVCPACSGGLTGRNVVVSYSPRRKVLYRCSCGVDTPTTMLRR